MNSEDRSTSITKQLVGLQNPSRAALIGLLRSIFEWCDVEK